VPFPQEGALIVPGLDVSSIVFELLFFACEGWVGGDASFLNGLEEKRSQLWLVCWRAGEEPVLWVRRCNVEGLEGRDILGIASHGIFTRALSVCSFQLLKAEHVIHVGRCKYIYVYPYPFDVSKRCIDDCILLT